MCCWEILDPGIHVDATLPRTANLNTAADRFHPLKATVFLDGLPISAM